MHTDLFKKKKKRQSAVQEHRLNPVKKKNKKSFGRGTCTVMVVSESSFCVKITPFRLECPK